MPQKADPDSQLKHALNRANEAARSGNLPQFERWSRGAERLRAILESHASPQSPHEAAREIDEARSLEIRRRLQAYVSAVQEFSRWKEERENYYEAVKAAVANNLEPPAPLRPHPAGPIGEEEYLRRIAQEGVAS